MKWTKALMAFTFVAATASVWACGNDNAAPTSACPKDDPTTESDESECKALAAVSAGQTAVTTRGCPACHGDDMSGQTEPLMGKDNYTKNVQGLPVKLYPPNLSPDNDTGIGAWADDELALAIRSGYDRNGLQLCPQMNHFSTMSDFEVYSIVMYLRSLPPVSKKVPRSVCPPTKPDLGQ